MSTFNSKPRFGTFVCSGAENGLEWNATNISDDLERNRENNNKQMNKKKIIIIFVAVTKHTESSTIVVST